MSVRRVRTAVIADLDTDITALSTQRSKLGAIQNRLEYTVIMQLRTFRMQSLVSAT